MLHSPFPPLPSPPLPAPLLPLLHSPLPRSRVRSPLGCSSRARKSRERSGSSARPTGEVGVGRRWRSAETPSCYDDDKALDSCLLQRAEAANVVAVLNLPPPLPDSLMVGKSRARSGRRIFRLNSEKTSVEDHRQDSWPNLANEANCFEEFLGRISAREVCAYLYLKFLPYIFFQCFTTPL